MVRRSVLAMALMGGRSLATLLAPIATQLTATGPGRALFFGMIAVSVSVPLRMSPHRFPLLDVVLDL